MMYLWVFGDNVEDALGHVFYALFYFAAAVAAVALQVAVDPNSVVPMVGASGAISG
jgi:membrane associated rhomboid family serine protease